MQSISRLVLTPHRWLLWIGLVLLVGYMTVCLFSFFYWVNPTLTGDSDQHIAADSSTYIYLAEVLEGKYTDPLAEAALATFPNTLWMPVLIAYLLKSTVAMGLFDVVLFCASIMLFNKASDIDVLLLVFLLLLNPTTAISLISVNKEIIDLFEVALFCYYLTTRHKWALALTLLVALVNRYEVCAAFLLYLILTGHLNPWRRRRWATLLWLALGLSVLLPVAMGHSLATRYEAASAGGAIVALDWLEMHYLFFLTIIPKTLENLIVQAFYISAKGAFSLQDVADSYILFFNNVATIIVLLVIGKKRTFTISSDWYYLFLVSVVAMSITLIIQPRYYYWSYVILCLHAAQRQRSFGRPRRAGVESINEPGTAHA